MNELLNIIDKIHERRESIKKMQVVHNPVPQPLPQIDLSVVDPNTWMHENIVTINKNDNLRKNNQMEKLHTTKTNLKKTNVMQMTYDFKNPITNSIDLAFQLANESKDNNIYLLVFGDFRYVGGSAAGTPKTRGIPGTQEEQIFIRTNVCKIYHGNNDIIFNKYDGKSFKDLQIKLGEYGFWVNPTRQYFYKESASNYLVQGGVYLIRDVYMIRAANGDPVSNPDTNNPINLIYAVAPMYFKRHRLTNWGEAVHPKHKNATGIEFTDEQFIRNKHRLNKHGLGKIEQYKKTVQNIFSLQLPTPNNNILMFGSFGMGVYVSRKGSSMGLEYNENINYVMDEYKKYINDNIHNTVYDIIYNIEKPKKDK